MAEPREDPAFVAAIGGNLADIHHQEADPVEVQEAIVELGFGKVINSY